MTGHLASVSRGNRAGKSSPFSRHNFRSFRRLRRETDFGIARCRTMTAPTPLARRPSNGPIRIVQYEPNGHAALGLEDEPSGRGEPDREIRTQSQPEKTNPISAPRVHQDGPNDRAFGPPRRTQPRRDARPEKTNPNPARPPGQKRTQISASHDRPTGERTAVTGAAARIRTRREIVHRNTPAIAESGQSDDIIPILSRD